MSLPCEGHGVFYSPGGSVAFGGKSVTIMAFNHCAPAGAAGGSAVRKLIGHVMYVRSEIHADDGQNIPVMTFGPISIAPEFKRQGYGTILLRESMRRAEALGAGALAIEGNIGFYGKSGFVVASTRGIRYAAEPLDAEVPYFLIRELKSGFLDGVAGTYQDPEGYLVDEAEAEHFDARFPFKEKQKLPGQLF